MEDRGNVSCRCDNKLRSQSIEKMQEELPFRRACSEDAAMDRRHTQKIEQALSNLQRQVKLNNDRLEKNERVVKRLRRELVSHLDLSQRTVESEELQGVRGVDNGPVSESVAEEDHIITELQGVRGDDNGPEIDALQHLVANWASLAPETQEYVTNRINIVFEDSKNTLCDEEHEEDVEPVGTDTMSRRHGRNNTCSSEGQLPEEDASQGHGDNSLESSVSGNQLGRIMQILDNHQRQIDSQSQRLVHSEWHLQELMSSLPATEVPEEALVHCLASSLLEVRSAVTGRDAEDVDMFLHFFANWPALVPKTQAYVYSRAQLLFVGITSIPHRTREEGSIHCPQCRSEGHLLTENISTQDRTRNGLERRSRSVEELQRVKEALDNIQNQIDEHKERQIHIKELRQKYLDELTYKYVNGMKRNP